MDMHHPLPALLAQGVSCALCDAESGLLSASGREGVGWRMTNIFWQTLQAWDAIDLATLGSLAENSVRWAAFEDQDPETWCVHSILPPSFHFTFVCMVPQKRRCLGDTAPAGAPPPKPGVRSRGNLVGRADKHRGRAIFEWPAWGPESRQRDCGDGPLSGNTFVSGSSPSMAMRMGARAAAVTVTPAPPSSPRPGSRRACVDSGADPGPWFTDEPSWCF
jgi:hypothetical protein